MQPPLAPAPEGRVLFSPTLTPLEAGEQLWPPQMPTYVDVFPEPPISPEANIASTRQIQEKLKREWVPVRGDVPPSIILDVFSYKSTLLAVELAGLTSDQLAGNMSPDLKQRLVRKTVNSQVGCIDMLTELGHDAEELVDNKLEVIDTKYNADKFTELRLYGPPEAPGRMSVREVAAYLKAHYDKKTGVQSYELRQLPVPEEEERARFADLSPFENWQQLRIAEWQVRAFGSDLSVSGSILKNMLGEYDEFMAEFNGLTPTKIDRIKDTHDQRWNNIGEEGADYLISSMGLLAAWEVCAQRGITSKVDQMKHDFKKAPALRARKNLDPVRALRVLAEQKWRLKHGLPSTYAASAA